MGAVTFPDSKVIDFVTQNVIPLQLPHDHKPLSDEFRVKWTPTLVTLDADGKEHHRTVGFLAPRDLIPSLILGRGKMYFDHENFEEALQTLDALLKDHRRSGAAPEAIFIRGVCLYKTTHQPKPLKDAYEGLSHPGPLFPQVGQETHVGGNLCRSGVRAGDRFSRLGEEWKKELLTWAADHALPSGVLPERLHPHTGKALSVSPLTWSHCTFLSTTLRSLRLKAGTEWAPATATREDWISKLFAPTCDAIHGACRIK